MAEFYDVDVPGRPARVKDIAALDEKLTAEIRRQTYYILHALAGGQSELAKLYQAECEEADKVPPRRRP